MASARLSVSFSLLADSSKGRAEGRLASPAVLGGRSLVNLLSHGEIGRRVSVRPPGKEEGLTQETIVRVSRSGRSLPRYKRCLLPLLPARMDRPRPPIGYGGRAGVFKTGRGQARSQVLLVPLHALAPRAGALVCCSHSLRRKCLKPRPQQYGRGFCVVWPHLSRPTSGEGTC